MKGKLTGIADIPLEKWRKRTFKARKNLLAKVCGLEPIFAPNIVREKVIKTDDGTFVECTGRDGRTLWYGHTKFERYPDNDYRFYSFRYALGRTVVARLDRLSNLLSVITEKGLSAKAVKPLVRLSLMWYHISNRDFNGLLKAVVSALRRDLEVRRPTSMGKSILRFKPVPTGAEIISKKTLVKVPLWDWRKR